MWTRSARPTRSPQLPQVHPSEWPPPHHSDKSTEPPKEQSALREHSSIQGKELWCVAIREPLTVWGRALVTTALPKEEKSRGQSCDGASVVSS